eukprot:12510759-Ditylum_brightwellii.AAC.1
MYPRLEVLAALLFASTLGRMAWCILISFCSVKKYICCPGVLLVDLVVAVVGLTAALILCDALDNSNHLGLKRRT